MSQRFDWDALDEVQFLMGTLQQPNHVGAVASYDEVFEDDE